ncbi:substrate-binding domain-containing protein [Cupriavidus sp. 30B13]|uniref:substrate-binding domain-containing protein n=1 Tax=Cupriavidus sp. 30B13 TaxID=3384241 RepID=UPI003B8EFED5
MKARRTWLGRLAATAVLGAALAAASGAAHAANAANATYRVGAAVYGMKGQFMQNWVREIKAHPAVKNGTVQLTVFDGNYDALTQNNQIETMLTQRYSGILFVPIDTRAGIGVAARAAASATPFIASNTMLATPKVPYIGNDDVQGGRLQAEALATRLGGKGNVVIIQGPIGQSAQIDREKGELEVLAKYPGIKVIEKKTANWSRAEAMNLMEDWLNAHPKGIHGVIAQNDDMALGALQAIKNRGLTPRDIPITSIDGMPDALQAAKKGEITTFLQDAQAQSQGALDLVLRQLVGASYAPQSAIWQRYAKDLSWDGGTAGRYILPWVPVTPENADALHKQVTGG